MLFRQLFDPISCTYTYLLASNYGQEALIIDPVLKQVNLYQRLIEECGLTLITSIETHTHADHITGSGELHKLYKCDIAMGNTTHATKATQTFKDGEQIKIDGITLTTIHTPGHTNDSFCFYIKGYLFTGDTLLIRGTGRTDFQEGDPYQQYHSIFHKILILPEDTGIYPGHDYNGMTKSTIWEEKKFNPRLQISSKESYATIMNQLNLKPPKMMDIAVQANLKCGLLSNDEKAAIHDAINQ